jgi:AbrB family looped-hinge helix DNA binding protein
MALVLLGIDGMSANVSRVTQNGRVVIPIKLREKLRIRRGTAVVFLEEDGQLILQPITKKYVARLRGVLKSEPSVVRTLPRERKRNRWT